MRLDKYLSEAGFGSRKEIKNHIKNGRVTLSDNRIAKPETHVENGEVFFDGQAVEIETGFRYYILNKPSGVITATFDKKEATVMSLLPPDTAKGLSPVGRLDKDTEGLLVLTDDGQLSHRLISPRHHVVKTYFLRTDKSMNTADIEAFRHGIDIGDDKPCLPAELKIYDDPCEGEVRICEGRFHQIKRMIEKCGKKVIYLERIAMGGLKLPGDIERGKFRKMTEEELECLKG